MMWNYRKLPAGGFAKAPRRQGAKKKESGSIHLSSLLSSAPWRLGALAIFLGLVGCGTDAKPAGPQQGQGKGERKFPVETMTVANQKIDYTVQAVGSVEAFETVLITARVDGVIDQVAFREGDRVDTETVLARIDAERYRLRVEAATNDQKEAQAELAEAKAGFDRRQALQKQGEGLVSGEELETWRTKLAAAQARADQRKTSLDLANLDLGYASVRSPVAGEIQTRQIRTGQRVEVGTPIATVLRRDPLLLRFQIPEDEAGRLKTGLTANFAVPGAEKPAQAQISYIASSADPASRMVAAVADVAKEDAAALRPGSFARITIPVASAERPVVNETAVRPTENGFLAYVVADGKAQSRVLELGLRSKDGKIEVLSGLSAGEQVVVRGAESLRDGMPVMIVGAKPESAP